MPVDVSVSSSEHHYTRVAGPRQGDHRPERGGMFA